MFVFAIYDFLNYIKISLQVRFSRERKSLNNNIVIPLSSWIYGFLQSFNNTIKSRLPIITDPYSRVVSFFAVCFGEDIAATIVFFGLVGLGVLLVGTILVLCGFLLNLFSSQTTLRHQRIQQLLDGYFISRVLRPILCLGLALLITACHVKELVDDPSGFLEHHQRFKEHYDERSFLYMVSAFSVVIALGVFLVPYWTMELYWFQAKLLTLLTPVLTVLTPVLTLPQSLFQRVRSAEGAAPRANTKNETPRRSPRNNKIKRDNNKRDNHGRRG